MTQTQNKLNGAEVGEIFQKLRKRRTWKVGQWP